MNNTGFIDLIWQDLRYAVRNYRRSPGFTLVALLSLMLGIGAATAMFSVVYGVLISPYPYAKPGEIWAPMLHSPKNPNPMWRSFSAEEFLDFQKLPAFAASMATGYDQILMSGDRPPESLTAPRMSPDAFRFLGVEPLIGRTLQPTDQTQNGEPQPVTVISYRLWQRLFNGSPGALGQKLVLNNTPHTIVGVMPPRFGWYTSDGLWLPLGSSRRSTLQLSAIVRLRDGVTPQAAEAQLDSFYKQLAATTPRSFPEDGFSARLRNYLDMTVASGTMQASLNMLFAAVGMLLLISCANVANLQLARMSVRAREIGIRLSIGAGRRRILRQLLTESVVLSVAGGILGIVFAIGLTRAITVLMPEFYTPNEARITVNWYVLAFSLGVSVLSGILFGMAPAFYSSRENLTDSLREGSRGSGASVGGNRTRSALVVAEVALSVILLSGAVLAIRGYVKLMQVDLGFQPGGVLSAGLPLPKERYATVEARNQFTRAVEQRLRTLPGVEAFCLGNGGLPFGGPRSRFTIDGQPIQGVDRIVVGLVGEGYIETMGVRLLRGRSFTETEVERGDRIAFVNEAAAKLWPRGQDAVGRHVQMDLLAKAPGPDVLLLPGDSTLTVIGVISDTRNQGLTEVTAPAIYVPYTLIAPNGRQLLVRAKGDPMQLLNAVRREIQAVDKDQALARPVTLEERVGLETVQPRFNLALFTFFAALGVILAAAGIFSVISYNVTQRTHEIGVRMALGATQTNIAGYVLGMGGRLIAIGLVMGLGAAFALVRTLQARVHTDTFDLSLFDSLSSFGVVALLSLVGLLACYLPARRAAELNPTIALRQD